MSAHGFPAGALPDGTVVTHTPLRSDVVPPPPAAARAASGPPGMTSGRAANGESAARRYDASSPEFDAAPETGRAMPPAALAAATAQNLAGIGHTFELEAADGGGHPVAPAKPYTTSVQYSAYQSTGIDASTLALYWWDGGRWNREPTSRVDMAARIVTAQPAHFSLWAVFGSGEPPTFTMGPDQQVSVDAGPQWVEHWATDIRVPPGQEYAFLVSTAHKELFEDWPDVDNAGTLTYTPKAGVHARATVTIYLAYGVYPNVTESEHKTFTITIGPSSRLYLPLVLRQS
jgi:hypothetical protein